MRGTVWFLILAMVFGWITGCGRDKNILSITFNMQNPDIVYIGTTGGGLYKSRDRGETFQKMNQGLSSYNITAVAVNSIIPTVVYAGTYGDSVYRSVNGAGYWTISGRGLSDNVWNTGH